MPKFVFLQNVLLRKSPWSLIICRQGVSDGDFSESQATPVEIHEEGDLCGHGP